MSELTSALNTLSARFLTRCAEDLPVLQQSASDATGDRTALRFVVHRMSGSAGMLGYAEVGDLAAQVDDELCATPYAGTPSLPALIDAIRVLIR